MEEIAEGGGASDVRKSTTQAHVICKHVCATLNPKPETVNPSPNPQTLDPRPVRREHVC